MRMKISISQGMDGMHIAHRNSKKTNKEIEDGGTTLNSGMQ